MKGLQKQLEMIKAEQERKELEHEKALIEQERKHNTELATQSKKYMKDIREYQMLFLKRSEEIKEEE